ncbi:Non-structural maintenance of chromosomes element 4 A [Podospora fimiseda]|uniref:Non-structural maintenance of chromosomes element 4 n=1 Tax=Podospora fimiseda TaxID=252190 RepID=A0AAN7BQB1_9PEZI|nr:Non-structural maintenance of chromosomes element 4 A [Podospora fimiseda]
MDDQQNLSVRSRGPDSSRKRASELRDEQPSTSRRRTRDPSPRGNNVVDEYDPDQSMQERRAIQRKLRDMQKDLRENPDNYMKEDPTALYKFLDESNTVMKSVKQTAEAAIDSRGLVIAAELAARRVQRLTAGNVGNGIDVDELVGKCITFMRNGGGIHDDNAAELSSTQRRRRQPIRGAADSDGEDDIGDEGDMLNWAHLGRFAATPSVRRPALPGFLLGPLSIEKKARKITKRSAPFRVNNLQEVRPQELRPEDLKKSDDNNLTTVCARIYELLLDKQDKAQNGVEDEIGEQDLPEEVQDAIMERHALRSTGGICLLRFAVNPHSFGQTIENLFYVSFLIRDGLVKLDFCKFDLPSLEPVHSTDEASVGAQKKLNPRHQAIMSMDMSIWRQIIEEFDMKEPMIPHRQEEAESGPGARGWYS